MTTYVDPHVSGELTYLLAKDARLFLGYTMDRGGFPPRLREGETTDMTQYYDCSKCGLRFPYDGDGDHDDRVPEPFSTWWPKQEFIERLLTSPRTQKYKCLITGNENERPHAILADEREEGKEQMPEPIEHGKKGGENAVQPAGFELAGTLQMSNHGGEGKYAGKGKGRGRRKGKYHDNKTYVGCAGIVALMEPAHDGSTQRDRDHFPDKNPAPCSLLLGVLKKLKHNSGYRNYHPKICDDMNGIP